MDAPVHFGYGQDKMADIPPERLIGPGVVIDVKDKARDNPNYAVTVQDIHDFEQKHGRIPPKAIIIMNSGWSEFFNDHQKYLGTTKLKDVTSLNFPGFGLEACMFLFNERKASILGVDTMSLDPGHSWLTDTYGKPYPCHHYLQPKNVPLLENVANLDAIPPAGTTMFLGGLKTKTGTGSPTRILAVVEDQKDKKDSDSEEE